MGIFKMLSILHLIHCKIWPKQNINFEKISEEKGFLEDFKKNFF